MLEILYHDEDIIAINKPHGLLVHRTKIAAEADEFALQLLRDQIGKKVYPVHRIDRKTSGVLLFALNEKTDRHLKMQFSEGKIKKTYKAIVRGFTEKSGTIDYPLRKENGQLQDAISHYKLIEHLEIPVPFGKHQTSRYSFIELTPETGRMHQLRKHMAHINHPIIGDRPHGCNKQNKLFKEKWGIDKMMLHAEEILINHPNSKTKVNIKANLSTDFNRVLTILKSSYSNVLKQ